MLQFLQELKEAFALEDDLLCYSLNNRILPFEVSDTKQEYCSYKTSILAIWGFASKKPGKQFKYKNCGYE